MENLGYAERAADARARMAAACDVARPVFHLTPAAGTLADPNGLVQVGDTYHVMHIESPLACEVEGRTPCVWAHWTTRDFVRWRREPVALWPDHPRDRDGVYSGSAVVRDGRLYLIYTGNVRHVGNFDYVTSGREQNVMRAESLDAGMTRFGEKRLLMTNNDFPATMTQHVRDPQVIERDGATYMLLGARTREDVGCVLVYRGDDLTHFSLVNTLTAAERFGYMWECPDLVTLEGRDYLLCCPQGIPHEAHRFQNAHQCGYFSLDGDFATAAAVGEFRQWDYGFDFYAARTLKGADRILLIGWLGMAETAYGATPSRVDGWDQVIAMPRELSWENERIYQRPVRELAQLRRTRMDFSDTATLRGRHFELSLTVATESSVRVCLREDCDLSYDPAAGELVLRMGPVCGAGRTERRMWLDELTGLNIFVDDTTLEIFVNDGWATMTSRLFGAGDECYVEAPGSVGSFWEMRGFTIEN